MSKSLRIKVKKRRAKRVTMPLHVFEARIEQLAEEEEALTRYEHGQEVG